MEKEILRQILSQLDDFRKDQIILLIIVFFVFIIINILQAVYTSRLVDKYRNELKKNEMRFSIFNELQINKLSNLFELTNELKYGAASIYSLLKSERKELNLEKLTDSYTEFDSFYNSNKYIIPKLMKSLISDQKKKLLDFKSNVVLLKEKYELTLPATTDISVEEKEECLNIIGKEIKDYNS